MNCLHSLYSRRWNLRSALAYYDDQKEENDLSRIFIEPPDEANTSCEESDDEEVPANISQTNCEVVLRNGKRLISEKLSDFDGDASSKRFKKDNDNKSAKKPKNSRSMITNASKKRHELAVKTRRKQIAQRNLKSLKTKGVPPIRSRSKPENKEGKRDRQNCKNEK